MPLTVRVSSAAPHDIQASLLVLPMAADQARSAALTPLDERLGGALGRTLERRDFRGGRDETLLLSGFERGADRVLLVGLGSPDDRAIALRRAASIAARQAGKLGAATASAFAGELDSREMEQFVAGFHAGSWKYDDLKTPPPESDRRPSLGEVTILVDDTKAAESGLEVGNALGSGNALARRMAMMPGNLCTPDFMAEVARELAAEHGMTATVWGREEMERESMGSFLSVAQGTPQEPRLITLEYRGGATDERPVVLVGKGLCFDSGGISIKPAQGMEMMKFDMGGAAGVFGAMDAIGRIKPRVNVVAIVGSTTNMPSGTAVKPGDVVRASNGKSIEVINTDAEGRLVLADLLVYADRFKPQAVLDAATLTGAIVIALGGAAVGVFGSDDELVSEVLGCGKRAGEPGWSFPMWNEYREQIKSDVADVKNTGGRAAGSITAALFLKEFIGDYPWVHLDVAGTAYSEADLVAIPKGPTGTPMGTFVEFVRGRAT